MSDKNTPTSADKCNFCDMECTQYEMFEGEGVQMCDDCYDELPVDEYSGRRVLEIVAHVSSQYGGMVAIGQETLDTEVSQCDWSNENVFSDQMIEIGGGDEYISHTYESDVGYCEDCGLTWSDENLTSHTRDCTTYCDGCIDEHPDTSQDRWRNRFRWYARDTLVNPANSTYPVRNGVGIEFEAEEGESISDNPVLMERIAVAEDDTSLNYGTEYCTHILQGDEIDRTVREMCKSLHKGGFTLSSRVGWHFHYSMRDLSVQEQKNVWKAMESFSDNVLHNHAIDDYAYFKHMTRQYARGWTSGYKEYASTWAKGNSDIRCGEYRGWANTETTQSPQKYTFVNWTFMHEEFDIEKERIEVRLYSPHRYMREISPYTRWSADAYTALAEDYLGFIQFWDEFVHISANGRLKMVDRKYDTLPLDRFARQFSDNTQEWLIRNYEQIKEKQE